MGRKTRDARRAGRIGLDRRTFVCGAAALGAAAALVPLAGCNSGSTDAGGAADADGGEAPAGTPDASATAPADTAAGTVVIGRRADSDNLDPVTCVGNTNIFIFNLILEGLVRSSDDGTEIEPCLAESWEVSDDGLVYTFHVMEGLTFSDGSDVTAEDWQWTFERAMETETSNWHVCVENIEGVECPDDTTVVVTMKQAAASTLANLSIFELGVQSKAYFDQVGAEEYQNGIIGTGPFMVQEWRRGEYLTLAANPHYRTEGVPLAPAVEFRVVADDNSRTIQLQGGDIDAATDLPFSTLSQLEGDANCQPHPDPSTTTRFLALNTANEYLANQQVREALFAATDARQVVDMCLYGYGTAIGSIFAPTSRFCDASLKPPSADVDKAKSLLDEAGYADGFDLGILIRGGDALEQQVATILQTQWKEIGVNLTIEETEATSYKERMYAMDFDVIIDLWTDDIDDPAPFMAFVFDFDSASGFDTNFRQPDDMVALNDAANVEPDEDARKELYAQMQQGFAEQCIWIPLFTVPYQNAVRNEVSGFVQTPLGNYRFDGLTKTV